MVVESSLVRKIELFIKNGLSLEEAFSMIDWKDFENVIGEIFELHGFKVSRNVIIKTQRKRRYQVDLVAESFDIVFVVDCKQWKKHRYKISELKKACLKQKERATMISSTLPRKKIVPLIITLLDEGILEFERVFIVPLSKLNYFLSNYHAIC